MTTEKGDPNGDAGRNVVGAADALVAPARTESLAHARNRTGGGFSAASAVQVAAGDSSPAGPAGPAPRSYCSLSYYPEQDRWYYEGGEKVIPLAGGYLDILNYLARLGWRVLSHVHRDGDSPSDVFLLEGVAGVSRPLSPDELEQAG